MGDDRQQSFLTPPPSGWLHDEFALSYGEGVYYSFPVFYVGKIKLVKSLRSVEFLERSLITQEAIARVRIAGRTRPDEARDPLDKECTSFFEGVNPVIKLMDVNISISVDGMIVATPDQEKIILNHRMTIISFATGGDNKDYDCVAYVAKCKGNAREVHVFDCGNLSNQVLATIGQAFVSAGEARPEIIEEEPQDYQQLGSTTYEEVSDYQRGNMVMNPSSNYETVQNYAAIDNGRNVQYERMPDFPMGGGNTKSALNPPSSNAKPKKKAKEPEFDKKILSLKNDDEGEYDDLPGQGQHATKASYYDNIDQYDIMRHAPGGHKKNKKEEETAYDDCKEDYDDVEKSEAYDDVDEAALYDDAKKEENYDDVEKDYQDIHQVQQKATTRPSMQNVALYDDTRVKSAPPKTSPKPNRAPPVKAKAEPDYMLASQGENNYDEPEEPPTAKKQPGKAPKPAPKPKPNKQASGEPDYEFANKIGHEYQSVPQNLKKQLASSKNYIQAQGMSDGNYVSISEGGEYSELDQEWDHNADYEIASSRDSSSTKSPKPGAKSKSQKNVQEADYCLAGDDENYTVADPDGDSNRLEWDEDYRSDTSSIQDAPAQNGNSSSRLYATLNRKSGKKDSSASAQEGNYIEVNVNEQKKKGGIVGGFKGLFGKKKSDSIRSNGSQGRPPINFGSSSNSLQVQDNGVYSTLKKSGSSGPKKNGQAFVNKMNESLRISDNESERKPSWSYFSPEQRSQRGEDLY